MKLRQFNKKKIGGVLLAGAVALSLIPMSAFAAENNGFYPTGMTESEAETIVKDYVQAVQFVDMTTDTENILDHFFDGTPTPNDAYAVTKTQLGQAFYKDEYYDAENFRYVIPYDVVAEWAARYFREVPDLRTVDLGFVTSYDADLNAFIIPEGGIGDAPYVVELMGVKHDDQDAGIVELYAKVSYQTAEGNPDMSDEADYAKCVLTVVPGEYNQFLSFKQVDAFPADYDEPTVTAADEETGIALSAEESAVPAGAVMNAKAVTDGADYDLVKNALKADAFTLYNINFTVDNAAVQPNGKVWIGMPVPEDYNPALVTVYYIAADGTVTEMDVDVDLENGDALDFETDSLGLFAIVEKAEEETTVPGTDDPADTEKPSDPADTDDTNSPNTGDNAMMVGAIALAGAAVLVLTRKKGQK